MTEFETHRRGFMQRIKTPIHAASLDEFESLLEGMHYVWIHPERYSVDRGARYRLYYRATKAGVRIAFAEPQATQDHVVDLAEIPPTLTVGHLSDLELDPAYRNLVHTAYQRSRELKQRHPGIEIAISDGKGHSKLIERYLREFTQSEHQ